MQTSKQIKDAVKDAYGKIAKQAAPKAQEGCSCCGPSGLREEYAQLEGHYGDADLNLGCGIPTQYAQIKEGDVVLDLGSGAGNDVFVARELVGKTGRVIGVDMTAEMIARAQVNRAKLGYRNVDFRLGEIEDLPVNTAEVDVVISNCVLNLVPEKRKAFQEIYRVLKPGGHFFVSDMVLLEKFPEELTQYMEMYAACVAGASLKEEYLGIIHETGFVAVEIKKEDPVTEIPAEVAQALSEEARNALLHSDVKAVSIGVFGKKPN